MPQNIRKTAVIPGDGLGKETVMSRIGVDRRVVRMPGNMQLGGIRLGDSIGATAPARVSDELN